MLETVLLGTFVRFLAPESQLRAVIREDSGKTV
jgi:hypothetical protein